MLRLEDERGPEPDRSLPATAAVDAGDTQLRHDAVTSAKQIVLGLFVLSIVLLY